MSRITKINFAGFASALALLTTTFALSMMAMGCAPPVARPVPPAPGSGGQGFISTPNVAGIYPALGVNDTSAFNEAQLNGLMGAYEGSYPLYFDKEEVQQPYRLIMEPVTNVSAAPGKRFIKATMTTFGTGYNVTIQTLVQIHMNAPEWGKSGPQFVFTSPLMSSEAYNPGGSIYFQFAAVVNQNTNLFDPTSPPIINIVDGESMKAVVEFKAYNDFHKL